MRLKLIILGILLSTMIFSKALTPLEISTTIFSQDSSCNPIDFATEEYLEYEAHPNSSDLATSEKVTYKLLYQGKNKAVVRISLNGFEANPIDGYLHFKHIDNSWKVAAFRSLAMTGIYYHIIEECKSLSYEDIQSMSDEDARVKQLPKGISKDCFNFLISSSKLLISSDEDLKKHFITNRNKFEKLKKKAIKEQNNFRKVVLLQQETNNRDKLETLLANDSSSLQEITIRAIYINNYAIHDGIKFEVGGLLDNRAGYLYTENKNIYELLDPNSIIMLEEIVPGWYIYKTT